MSKPVVRITIEVYDLEPAVVKFEQLIPEKPMKGRYLALCRKALAAWWKTHKRGMYREVRKNKEVVEAPTGDYLKVVN